jgi:hypothetical protein
VAAKRERNPPPDYWEEPEWRGPGSGEKKWRRGEDMVAATQEGLLVIEGEVLYPERIWGISMALGWALDSPEKGDTLPNKLRGNPNCYQYTLFPEMC